MVLSELRTQPDPDILRHCYFRQIRYFKPLSEDISHYRRATHLPDKSDYSFECLFESANRYLLMKREDAMQDALSRGLMGTTDRDAPGIPQTPKGAGKGDRPNSVPRERSKSSPPGGGEAPSVKRETEKQVSLLCLPDRHLHTRKRQWVRARKR